MISKISERKEVRINYQLFNLLIERAVVGDVRKCTTCRECIRSDKFRSKVDLGKIKDRFEFHVESVGILPPEVLVQEALKILKNKATYWLDVLENENEIEDEEDTQKYQD